MTALYHWTVFVHVLSAVTWLGGMFALALLAPILRATGDEAARQTLFKRLGERFRIVGWIAIALLLVTGVGQLQIRGWWGMGVWGSPAFWASRAGVMLAWKLAAVAIMLAVQAAHDFWLGPRAGRVEPGTAQARRLRRVAALLARGNALVGLVVIWVAVALARGL